MLIRAGGGVDSCLSLPLQPSSIDVGCAYYILVLLTSIALTTCSLQVIQCVGASIVLSNDVVYLCGLTLTVSEL